MVIRIMQFLINIRWQAEKAFYGLSYVNCQKPHLHILTAFVCNKNAAIITVSNAKISL